MGGPSLRADQDRDHLTIGAQRTPRIGASQRSGLAKPEHIVKWVYQRENGNCSFCQIHLETSKTAKSLGEVAELVQWDAKLNGDVRAMRLACTCCALERNPDTLVHHLDNRNAHVMFWLRDEHPSPDQIAATTRAMVAALDDMRASTHMARVHAISSNDYPRLIMEAFRKEGLVAVPIWQAPREFREMFLAYGKQLRLPTMPANPTMYTPGSGTAEEEAWTSTAWGQIIAAQPSLWFEHRDRLLLLPGQSLARNRHFDLKGYLTKTLYQLEADTERTAYLRSKYGDYEHLMEA